MIVRQILLTSQVIHNARVNNDCFLDQLLEVFDQSLEVFLHFPPSPTSLTPKASSKCGANVANTTFALDLHGSGKSGANVAFTYSFGPDLLTFALCKYGANPFFQPVLLPYTQMIFLFLQMHL